jgi:hypothetical protein
MEAGESYLLSHTRRYISLAADSDTESVNHVRRIEKDQEGPLYYHTK